MRRRTASPFQLLLLVVVLLLLASHWLPTGSAQFFLNDESEEEKSDDDVVDNNNVDDDKMEKKAKKEKGVVTVPPTLAPIVAGVVAVPAPFPTTIAAVPVTIIPPLLPTMPPKKTSSPTRASSTAAPTLAPGVVAKKAKTSRPTSLTAPAPVAAPTGLTTTTTTVLNLPVLQIALEPRLMNRRLSSRRSLMMHMVELVEADLGVAVHDFLDEFLDGRFPDQYQSVQSTSTLDKENGLLTTTGNATFVPSPGVVVANKADLDAAITTYFEFFGRQELEEDLAEYGVASVNSIRLDGRPVEERAATGGQQQPGVDGAMRPDQGGSGGDEKKSLGTTPLFLAGIVAAGVVLCLAVAFLAVWGGGRRRPPRADGGNDVGVQKRQAEADRLIQPLPTADSGLEENEDNYVQQRQQHPKRQPTVTETAEEDEHGDDDDADDHGKAGGTAGYPKPVYIRPYAENRSDDEPSEYTSDGDIVSIGSAQISITPKKIPAKLTGTAAAKTATLDATVLPSNVSPDADAAVVAVAKSGKTSLRSYQYDANKLGQVISQAKQGSGAGGGGKP